MQHNKRKQRPNSKSKIILTLIAPLALAACARSVQPDARVTAANLVSEMACSDFKSQLWSELYRLNEANAGYPSAEAIETAIFNKLLESSGVRAADHEQLKRMSSEVAHVYGEILTNVDAALLADASSGKNPQLEKEKVLISLELGDRSTPEKESLQDKIALLDQAAREIAAKAGLKCAPVVLEAARVSESALNAHSEMTDAWKANLPSAVFGAYLTMATAYQSCDAVDMPALDKSTPDAKGIGERSQKTSSGGRWRYVSDATLFIHTNPYYRGYAVPDQASCFDVTAKPLIYDYGGKPVASSVPGSEMNLFKEAGSGAPDTLGIDCSGFVVTAHLAAGLKLKSDSPLRPNFVHQIPARLIMAPDSVEAKLNCLKYVSASAEATIKPGDMIASSGHVVMIDSVGADPFGISALRDISQCQASNIDASRFDFTIVHSAPGKGALGLHKIQASAYFPTSAAMRDALVQYGVAACQARFGKASTPKPSSARIVRHSGEPQCIDQAKAAPLTNVACLNTCPASRSRLSLQPMAAN